MALYSNLLALGRYFGPTAGWFYQLLADVRAGGFHAIGNPEVVDYMIASAGGLNSLLIDIAGPVEVAEDWAATAREMAAGTGEPFEPILDVIRSVGGHRSLSTLATGTWIAWDLAVYLEFDGALGIGIEFAFGVVLDFDGIALTDDSGVFGTWGGALGANGGVGISVGFAQRETEGMSWNGDVNLGKLAVSASWDSEGWNGGAASWGPGAGASFSVTDTSTYSFSDFMTDSRRAYWQFERSIGIPVP
jgi:hypothetical protein